MVTIPIRFRYVHEDVDRHGNVRIYFRKPGGPKIRMRASPGTPEFAALYHAIVAGQVPETAKPPARLRRPAEGTWRWLCVAYMESRAFHVLGPSTRTVRRGILSATWAEPVLAGTEETFAEFPLDRVTPRALAVLRDRAAPRGPESCNARVKAMRAVYKWAAGPEVGLVSRNPARDVGYVANATSGFRTWTPDELAQFEATWPIGSKPRLAFDLLVYAGGPRRSDLVRLGRPHLRSADQVSVPGIAAPHGWMQFRPQKTGPRGPLVTIPILEPLARSIAATRVGEMTFLATEYGRPFTAAGFGNWFRRQCDAAGLAGCSAHGVRKAASVRCAEAGASAHELMALFGWTRIEQAELYTRAADRARLSAGAASMMLRPPSPPSPLPAAMPASGATKRKLPR